ncbi:MAG: NAD(P)-dependent oxidoreductase [Candidatus Odinarchaeota archaeon]
MKDHGPIAREFIKLLSGFDPEILATCNSPVPADSYETFQTKNLLSTLSRADVVIIALPLTLQTRALLGERELGLMKPSALVVNIARGDIIVEEPLYNDLKANKILGAGLDVW